MIDWVEREWVEEVDYFHECEHCDFADEILVVANADRHSATADIECPGCGDKISCVTVRGSIEDGW